MAALPPAHSVNSGSLTLQGLCEGSRAAARGPAVPGRVPSAVHRRTHATDWPWTPATFRQAAPFSFAMLMLLPTALCLVVAKRTTNGPARACADSSLSGAYPSEHENYICKNYSRAWPLPCMPPRRHWRPKWGGEQPGVRGSRGDTFVTTAWWAPHTVDWPAYANASFNV